MHRLVRLSGLLLMVNASLLFGADCAELRNLKLESTTIDRAEPVTAGVLEIAGADGAMQL